MKPLIKAGLHGDRLTFRGSESTVASFQLFVLLGQNRSLSDNAFRKFPDTGNTHAQFIQGYSQDGTYRALNVLAARGHEILYLCVFFGEVIAGVRVSISKRIRPNAKTSDPGPTMGVSEKCSGDMY